MPAPPPAAPSVVAPASEARREEVAYATLESPVGELLVAATDHGVVRVAYVIDGPEGVLDDLADRVSPVVVERPHGLRQIRDELAEYFAGRRRRFDVPLDRRLLTGFRRALLEATATIPYGEVATYGEVARLAGRPGAARAAGGALGSNPLAIVIPCHRVVAGAGLGGYGPGVERKRVLLELEGALAPRLAPGGWAGGAHDSP
ncbi:MAG: methylated-DNA--[protein]-cysteine S-methyltransferase [Solirubrobacteraceae bacterium]